MNIAYIPIPSLEEVFRDTLDQERTTVKIIKRVKKQITMKE